MCRTGGQTLSCPAPPTPKTDATPQARGAGAPGPWAPHSAIAATVKLAPGLGGALAVDPRGGSRKDQDVREEARGPANEESVWRKKNGKRQKEFVLLWCLPRTGSRGNSELPATPTPPTPPDTPPTRPAAPSSAPSAARSVLCTCQALGATPAAPHPLLRLPALKQLRPTVWAALGPRGVPGV